MATQIKKKQDAAARSQKQYRDIKNLYAEQLEKYLKSEYLRTIDGYTLTESEQQQIRKGVRSRLRYENFKQARSGALTLAITVVATFSLVWLVREWFNIGVS